MNKLCLFFGPRVVKNDLIRQWTENRSYVVMYVEGINDINFKRKWDKISKKKNPAFFFDYPVDFKKDLDTFDMFISHVLENGGEWYYAPRPNDFVDVTYASMIGMSSAVSFGGLSIKEHLKPIAKSFIEALPKLLKKPIYKYALRLYQNNSLNLFKDNQLNISQNSNQKNNFKPIIKPPVSLRQFDIKWTNWQAPRDVLKYDLLDRVEIFFPQPSNIHVIVLNQCNLKCGMCPYHSPKYKPHQVSGYFDKRKALSLNAFQKIAQYAGSKKVGLQFGQIEEVLMHKQFFEFLKISKECKVPQVHVTTNGVLLDQKKAHKLASSGVTSVMFSVDSVNPETYREIRGDDLVKLENNIKYFMPLANKAGITVTASFILQPQAIIEREEFLDKWKKLGVDQVTFYVLTEHDIKTGAFIREGEEMYDKGERYPCASPWTQAVMFPEGEMSLCCKTMTDVGWRGVVSVGSVPMQTMDEIWTGNNYRKVREELLDQSFDKFPVCKDCEIWSASTSIVEEGKDFRRTFNETMETYQFL